MNIPQKLIAEFKLQPFQVEKTIALIDDGNTIPFIARYRKEVTGSLDDQVLRAFADRLEYLKNLDKRRSEVANIITEQGKMTDEISLALEKAETQTEIEDIYRPYKQKRKTRASVAREKGLEPLSIIIINGGITVSQLEEIATTYVDEEKGVNTVTEAIDGALDIIAEDISDNANYRREIRRITYMSGILTAKATKKAKDDQNSVYKMYFDYSEPVPKVLNHRVLAINRGESEDALSVSINVDENVIFGYLEGYIINDSNRELQKLLMRTIKDAYKRLISPSIEREIRTQLTERANEKAIAVFAENLKNLLLQPPVEGKVILGLDPAYRTGCKIAVIDATGKVLDTTVVYPTPPQSKVDEAERVLLALINKHKVDVVAIGNGTASKESEIFVVGLIKKCTRKLEYIIVSESGASVYSASKLAAEEFPQFDVSLRSAVSIARRLSDPLAELVKIDPRAIGVGQYQHDMPANELSHSLGGVVESCVNSVGVDLNTASHSLLSYIAGINAALAKSVIAYREKKGRFNSRFDLLNVPRMGEKSFEQCAGFLRITNGENIFDNTSVHPESYASAKKLLMVLDYTLDDVVQNKLGDIEERLKRAKVEKIASEINIGVLTLLDIASELAKPGRDIRDSIPAPQLRQDILDIKDLKAGMIFTGTVRNVIDFGAFVDIGVHQDGLVHISKICDRYIKHPSEVLKVGDIVSVKVEEIDVARKRISLTMRIN